MDLIIWRNVVIVNNIDQAVIVNQGLNELGTMRFIVFIHV